MMDDKTREKIDLLDCEVHYAVLKFLNGQITMEEADSICHKALLSFKDIFPSSTKEYENLSYRLDPNNPRSVLTFAINIYKNSFIERQMNEEFAASVKKNYNKVIIAETGMDSYGSFKFSPATAFPDRTYHINDSSYMVEFKHSCNPEVALKVSNLQSYRDKPTVIVFRSKALGYFIIGPNLQKELLKLNPQWGHLREQDNGKDLVIANHYKMSNINGMFFPKGTPLDIKIPFADIES